MTLLKTTFLKQLFVCALIAAGLCVVLPLQSSAETLSQYDNMLASLSQGLSSALKQEQARAGSSAQTIAALHDKTPLKMRVSTPEGEVIEADFTSIRAALNSANYSKGKDRIKDITALSAKVQALRDASSGLLPGKSDRAEAAGILKKELADNRYKSSPMEDLMKKFLEARDRLFENLSIPAGVAGAIGWTVLAIVIIGCIAGLVYLVLRIVAYYSVAAPKRDRMGGQQQVVRRAAPTLKSILETSEKQASKGLYREAYRNMYIAAILTLDKAKLISYADGVTNREYLRALSKQSSPDAAEIFKHMTTSFDELIYGKQQVSSQHYEACVDKYKSLEGIL